MHNWMIRFSLLRSPHRCCFNQDVWRRLPSIRRWHSNLHGYQHVNGDDLRRTAECAEAVTNWHLLNGLLLNSDKTTAILTGTRHQVEYGGKLPTISLSGHLITTSSVKLLGVTIEGQLTFSEHVTNVIKACNFHLHALRHIRNIMSQDDANAVAVSLINSRLDYCNGIFTV